MLGRISVRRRSLGLALALVLVIVGVPSVAYGGWITSYLWEEQRNPGPFPDTCDIHGWTTFNSSGDWIIVWAKEDANCARLQIKARYRNLNNVWVTYDPGWKFVSSYNSGYRGATNHDWSDHNGDNNGSGTAYGFRINFP